MRLFTPVDPIDDALGGSRPSAVGASEAGQTLVKGGASVLPSPPTCPRRMTEDVGHAKGPNAQARSPWDQIINDYLGGSDGKSGRRMTSLD